MPQSALVASSPLRTRLCRATARCFVALLLGITALVNAGDQPERVAGPPPAEAYADFATGNPIDAIVLAKLKSQGFAPSPRCTDAVFLRRAFIDAIATLPTADEARAFLKDTRPDKRERLIDMLLARTEFADAWGLKWGDLLRIKAEFPSNLWPEAAQAYDRWVRDRLRQNMPYDQFVRELLTSSGSNFRDPPVNFYRAFQDRSPRQIAENVAVLFMGRRFAAAPSAGAGSVQAAGDWSEGQIQGLAAFFTRIGYKSTGEWKEEIVFTKADGSSLPPVPGKETTGKPSSDKPVAPAFPDGSPAHLGPDDDPRQVFAAWLTSAKNPYFAKAMANRTWYWLLGRGIVHEPDDMRPSNPPWSAELLDRLGQELVVQRFDVRRLFRLIMTSNTYQAGSQATRWNAGDSVGFSHYRTRRLDAEVLIDALTQVTGITDDYVSDIPEPFTHLNARRAITLPDGSIVSPFLELFGRPGRNTSFESERTNAFGQLQAQYLLNSSHIQGKFERSPMLKALAAGPTPIKKTKDPTERAKDPAEGAKDPAERAKGATTLTPAGRIEELYLRILSRPPTEAENATGVTYLKDNKRKPAESLTDLAWALVNSKEFLLRH